MSLYGCCAAALCEKIQKFVSAESSNALSAAHKILRKAETFNAEGYSCSIPRPETYETRLLDNGVDLPTPNFRAVFVRTNFCSFRLKFLLCLWELLLKIQSLSYGAEPSSLPARIDRVASEVQSIADELLAATPGIFRSETRAERSTDAMPKYWTDGLRLMWPLRLIAFWPVMRLDQRRLAASFLRSIRRELGLLQATQDYINEPGRSHPAAGSFPETET